MLVFRNHVLNLTVQDISDAKTIEQIAQEFGGNISDWTEIA